MLKNLKEFFSQYKLRGVNKLFVELQTNLDSSFEPIFNLTEEDTETTYSLKKLFMRFYRDPHEITFVDEILAGRYDLWKSMCSNKELSSCIKVWREEARARYLADNFKQISSLADGEDKKTTLAALKYLSSAVLAEAKETSDRGRPSKKEIQQKLNEITSEDKEIQEAFARVQSSPYC